MVEGGMKCAKFFLFIFNLIFFLAGLGLIITGAIIQARFRDAFVFFEGSTFSSAAVLLIVIGCVIFIVAFFGCCGALKENYCMIMFFAILLIIIFIVEIGVGIAAFVMKNDVEKGMRKKMIETMSQYSEAEGVKKTWDHTQTTFKCCGVDGPADWTNTTKGNSTVPESCCKKQEAGCASTPDNIYSNGCIAGFTKWVENNIHIIGGVVIGLALIQIFGIILACCLARAIKEEYEVV